MVKHKEVDIDYKKLNEEDRRMLLNFWTDNSRWIASNILVITSLFLSVVAIIVSAIATIIVFKKELSHNFYVLLIFFAILLIAAYFICIKANKKFENLAINSDQHYKELFEIHFKYATKNKK